MTESRGVPKTPLHRARIAEGLRNSHNTRAEYRYVKEAREAALHVLIPEDTRTPGQKLMGEPLPGRSALDRKVRGVSL